MARCYTPYGTERRSRGKAPDALTFGLPLGSFFGPNPSNPPNRTLLIVQTPAGASFARRFGTESKSLKRLRNHFKPLQMRCSPLCSDGICGLQLQAASGGGLKLSWSCSLRLFRSKRHCCCCAVGVGPCLGPNRLCVTARCLVSRRFKLLYPPKAKMLLSPQIHR